MTCHVFPLRGFGMKGVLMKNLAAFLLVVACRCAVAADIEAAKVEQTGPGVYSIQFQGPPDEFPIAVYANSDPGQAGSGNPVATAVQPANVPIVVNLPAASGRVYFHLKPRSGLTRVVSIRRLPLDGAPNFRDLGGYRTADGCYVKWGSVYRAGQLSGLSGKDYQYLDSIGIRLVCDFRIDSERNRAQTKWNATRPPEILAASIDTITYAKPGVDIREHMKTVYGRMPFDAATEFGGILRRFARGDLPALVHCTAGKDRTGFFSALLLMILGVPNETVREDFVLTNEYLVPDDKIPAMAKAMQDRLKLDSLPDVEAVRVANGVDPENLAVALRVISEKYGSFEGYLHKGLALSDCELKALRDRLLEK
jgi:protein-tyrosine phosphatase